ncbi:TonB-dependent siderophore receptor [Filomicrobium sp.]|uniref:TonB-dependent siderophore receptor n=1 Tax=Filomicrobium sp. TaxID=2024831 RepID=UPI00258ED632|nr:TonB-dependent siderophore receptor [Filomicrobium sp.]MCV0370191.1 TonB-dependent siderophore receptor [Filomicrobium sp.]
MFPGSVSLLKRADNCGWITPLTVTFISLIASHNTASAQEAVSQSATLPPVTVIAPASQTQQPSPSVNATSSASTAAPTQSFDQINDSGLSNTAPPQNRNDPGTSGFVATMSGVGTKTPGSVLDTPRSISTVSKAEIEERNAQSVLEALQYTSGVNSYYFSGNFLTREQALVRGFLVYQYLDGLKQHDSNWAIEPYGLERVDLLKGPASMLYGQGSPGGLLDLTSKRPTDEAFTEVVLQAGTHSKFQTGVDFGGPIGNGRVLTYRMTALGRLADGEVDYTENDRLYVAPALTFRPNADTSFTLLSSYQHDPSLTVQQALPREGTILPGPNGQYIPRELFLGEPGYHDTSKTSFKIGYEFKHRFDNVWSFEQNAAYRHIDIALSEVMGMGSPSGPTSTRRQMFDADYVINTYQVDSRLHGNFSTGPLDHKLLVGFDYAAIPNYQGQGVNRASLYSLDLYNPVYGQPLGSNPITSKRYQDLTQAGLYLQDAISVGGLTVTAGIRHDWAELNQETLARDPVTGNFGAPIHTPKEDKAFTHQLGAIYRFANGFAPFVSYSESFFPLTGSDAGGNPFEPTTGEQSEVGIKFMPPGVNALFTASVFDITQQNVRTPDLANPGFATQTGEVAVRGAELEVRASLESGWNFAAAYTYLDSEVTKTNQKGAGGKSFTSVPAHQASLWGSYTFFEGAFRGLTIGGGVRFFGEAAGDTLNTFYVPAFTLYDATVRYDLGTISPEFENWEFAVNAKNLTDERYVTNCDSTYSCYYGVGRTVDASLRMRF